ncbi:MAG: hypothetical protein IPK97_16980 [Ahniella sp.]|nr:hypothetical protein [Ahniella sp.]
MTPEILPLLIWFNIGLLMVLALRMAWHRTSTPAQAYGLWILPLLLVFVAWLPLAPEVRVLHIAALPAVAEPVRSSITDPLLLTGWATASAWFFGVSLTGSFLLGLVMWRRHDTLRNLLLVSPESSDARCPGLKIRRAEFGPALVGITQPTLVLPHEFETRFTARQQDLAITHEYAHWRSGDLPIRAFAWGLVALQWWNPLAWWSLARFIEDQELANDARVLAEWPGMEHEYAHALVQSSSTQLSPLACAMQPTHPLLWRISMLKSHSSHRAARRWMASLTGLTLVSLAGLAMALDPTPVDGTTDPFTVALDVQIDEGSKSSFAVAGPAGTPMAATIDNDGSTVALELTVQPTNTKGHVLVAMDIRRDGELIAEPTLQVAINGEGRIEAGAQVEGRFEGIRLDLKVSEGLPKQAATTESEPAKLRIAKEANNPPIWQRDISWMYKPEDPGC